MAFDIKATCLTKGTVTIYGDHNLFQSADNKLYIPGGELVCRPLGSVFRMDHK